MISKINTWTLSGVRACEVYAEVDLSRGLSTFQIVGLPEAAVRESRDRVRAAIKNSGFSFPLGRITVNLSPADIKKQGTGFDLPIALGILANTGVIKNEDIQDFLICGELSLDGGVKSQPGVLSGAILAKNNGYKGIIIPRENISEGDIINGIEIISINSLSDAVMVIRGEKEAETHIPQRADPGKGIDYDFNEVRGQEHAKRALEISAAGGHNVLMSGPPGSGKTMLAKRINTILPEMGEDEILQVSMIYSAAGLLSENKGIVDKRPFRDPHHTISYAGLIGGGRVPRPGEISLAHKGVLFLDELTEFRKDNLEMLRQPLESMSVIVSRAEGAVEFPADFILIAAMNPCPCGYLTSRFHECRCTPSQVLKYKNRISGPLMDRIDMRIEVSDISYSKYIGDGDSRGSDEMGKGVARARKIQAKRFESELLLNSAMKKKDVEKFCVLDEKGKKILKIAFERYRLSARSMDRILKVSRTIADLEGSENIMDFHIAEAMQYRVDTDLSRV